MTDKKNVKKSEVDIVDIDENLMKKFVERFSLKKLAELAEEEEETTKRVYTQKKCDELRDMGVKNPKPILCKSKEYELCYPKTIKYLNENIFMSDTGVYYISSTSDDGVIMPKEMTKDQLTNFKLKFPNDIRTYFEKYSLNVYHIVVNQQMPRIYEKNDVLYLNLFQGYKFDGKQRNKEICDKNKDKVKFIWDHIHKIWCNNNDIYFKEIKNWICALLVGKRKLKTAIYLKGKMGIGKGKICDLLTWIIGNLNCITLINEHAFTGQFNGQLAGKTFVNLNEIVNSHDDFVSLYNRLKAWITDDMMTFRDLYSKPICLQNLCSFILSGNHDMFKLENGSGNDRRFIIVDTSDNMPNDDYLSKLNEYCITDDKVKEAFYWDCVDNYDVNYNEQISIKKLPISQTKQTMILKTLSIVTQYLKDRLIDPDFFIDPFVKRHFHADYLSWHQARQKIMKTRNPVNAHDFFTELMRDYKEVFIEKDQIRVKGVPTKNVLLCNAQSLFSFMDKKGYISKHDEINEIYKSVKKVEDVKEKNIYSSIETEYWELERQKLELQDKQDVLEMKMNGTYLDFMRMQDQKNDPLEYGINEVEQKIEPKKELIIKRIIKPKTEPVLDEESKKNINDACKKLNAFFKQDFFIEY